MGRNDPTVEEILRMIARQDERALRDEQRLLSLFADYSRGKMAAQQRQLAIFCQCDGHITIQKLRGASGTDQQLGYHRLIREMVDGYGLRREVALDISGAYWRVALGTEPPETSSPRPTPPEPTPPKPQPEPKPVPPKPQPESRPPEKSTEKRGGRSPLAARGCRGPGGRGLRLWQRYGKKIHCPGRSDYPVCLDGLHHSVRAGGLPRRAPLRPDALPAE